MHVWIYVLHYFYITLHGVTFRCVTLRFVALLIVYIHVHDITLRYVALRYVSHTRACMYVRIYGIFWYVWHFGYVCVCVHAFGMRVRACDVEAVLMGMNDLNPNISSNI